MRHLLSIALSSHGGNTAAGGGREDEETWEGVRVRGVQEVALAMVRLLRASVQLMMLSEKEALALRERELERQRKEMTEAASAHEDAAADKVSPENAQSRSTLAVLPLMDLYSAAPCWAPTKRSSPRAAKTAARAAATTAAATTAAAARAAGAAACRRAATR